MKQQDNGSEQTVIRDLMDFISRCPSPWHVIEEVRRRLLEHGFRELEEGSQWEIEPGTAYFCIRSDAAIAAFRTPEAADAGTTALWIAAHTDSPSLVLKPSPLQRSEQYTMLSAEVYGGALWNSWLNRELGMAGRLVYRDRDHHTIGSRLITSDISVSIPQLGIHLDREVNQKGLQLNPQDHLRPILTVDAEGGFSFSEYLHQFLTSSDELIGYELELFDRCPPRLTGVHGQLIDAPKLDDLAMVHAGLTALCEAHSHASQIIGCVFFNHEEVGSVSTSGAASSFFPVLTERIHTGLGLNREQYLASLAGSFLISADMTHAVHPNYPGRHDGGSRPVLGGGPAVKWNASQRYATTAATAAQFASWAAAAQVRLQEFVSRNDMPCGSTIGPGLSARMGIPAVDVGSPLLSMHAIRECTAAGDHLGMIDIFRTACRLGIAKKD